jgi:hypothetical protein
MLLKREIRFDQVANTRQLKRTFFDPKKSIPGIPGIEIPKTQDAIRRVSTSTTTIA